MRTPRGRRRTPAWIVVLGLAAVLLVGAGCGGRVDTLAYTPAPSTTTVAEPPSATLPGNLSAISEGAVPGVTTTTAPPLGPGSATLNGTVLGPQGTVAGAVVEADRIVGDKAAVGRTTTAADGSWTLPNILGGRYRIRAWQSPSLDMATPQVVFLAATQTLSLSLPLTQFKGPNVAMAVSPPNPVLGQPTNLVVQVTNPAVGPDGVVRNPPVTGTPVTLVNGPGWGVSNGNPLNTDASGQVLFRVTCTAPGPDPLSAEVGTNPPVSLPTPSCSPPPTTTLPNFSFEPTTTCPPATGSTLPGTTTSLPTGATC